jgi:hypothetical protein
LEIIKIVFFSARYDRVGIRGVVHALMHWGLGFIRVDYRQYVRKSGKASFTLKHLDVLLVRSIFGFWPSTK